MHKDNPRLCQCEAITSSMKRCRRKAYTKIPNIISGTGVGKNDWQYGREVNLCNQHGFKFMETKESQKVIENGFLQPYNRHGYGSVVLVDVMDWEKIPVRAYQPQFWNKSE